MVRLGEEVPWDEELQAELAWIRRVLTAVHIVGQRIVSDYDLSVIETYPLRVRLVVIHICYPGGDMESATVGEGPYIVHVRESDRDER